MADKYDKLLTDYYTGTLDKKLFIFEGLPMSKELRKGRLDEYQELQRLKETLDNVIGELSPLPKAIMQARYGEHLMYAELQERFNRSSTTLHEWKNKVKKRMREAGL
ncbi:hypothetical protein [Weissella confusa]